MVFCPRSLVRHNETPVGSAAGTPNRNQISQFIYATDDAAALVEASGYFNAARGGLTSGSTIDAVTAVSGAPIGKQYVVLAVPPTGDVTVSLFGGTGVAPPPPAPAAATADSTAATADSSTLTADRG